MSTRGADLLVATLEANGVELVFGYPGGAIMPVYDALVDSSLRHILTRHEQAAALAADGYARATGRVGVCMATSGPGATNLVTGIANAFMDSVPLLVITGQVPTGLMGTDAFQEVDIFGMTMPVVKHSFLVKRAEDTPAIVAEALKIATSGRPGPVHIDLPKDVTLAEIDAEVPEGAGPDAPHAPDMEAIERAIQFIAAAERPVIYAGGGVGMAGAVESLRRFADASGIPLVATLKGLGVLPTWHEQFLGMLGMHGNRAANMAVQASDLLICTGARFDDRATGRLDGFAPDARVIHLDIDAGEIGKLRSAEIGITGDMGLTVDALSASPLIRETGSMEWRRQCGSLKRRYAPAYDAPGEGIYAPALLRQESERIKPHGVITCDVGQHQMWVAQHCHIPSPEQHLTSGGLGTMGFGLPSAMGVQLAQPDRTVVCVTGDGSIMMNVQELTTLLRYALPIKILLLDNQALGMVRQWQELFHQERYSEVDLSDNPDFAAVARAFGIAARGLDARADTDLALDWWLAQPGPALLHVAIDPAENVWPLVPPGAANHDMMEEART